MDESKMCLAAWIASVTTMIFLALETCTAWLMLHLIKNNSASVEVTLVAWWSIFARILQPEWMCNIEVTMLFLILASAMTRTFSGFEENSLMGLLSEYIWLLKASLSSQFTIWKERQLEKLSIRQKPEESFWWSLSKKGRLHWGNYSYC